MQMFIQPMLLQFQTNALFRQKNVLIVLDASLLNTQHFKVWVKGKWSNPGKRVEPSLLLCVEAFKLPLTTVS